jgi:hypothetical protein
MKTFDSHFDMFKKKLTENENFAFLRFSDGELYVLQNKRLELNSDHFIIGDSVGHSWYGKEEQKKFIPEEHQFYREKLIESLKCKKNNYFRGISTKPNVDEETFKWQLDIAGGDDDTMTWANLFIESNYHRYLTEMVPIFKTKKIIMVVNKSANLEKLGFNIVKDFRVGDNCFINDYNIIEVIDEYINHNNIEGHLFLISAASLSNLIIHQLYEKFPNNTYLDIGSTLNPLMSLDGWKGSRAYLREYWLNENRNNLSTKCEW